MSKLLDIMHSMNVQITKLAEAVADAVQSSDEEKVCDYRKLYGTDDRKRNVSEEVVADLVEGNEDNLSEQESENEQEDEDEESVHVIDKEDDVQSEDDNNDDSVKQKAIESKSHLMKDLRDHLFA